MTPSSCPDTTPDPTLDRSIGARTRRYLWLAMLAAIACAVAVVSFILTRETGRTAAIWPVNAIFLVLVMRAPQREWAGLLAALFAGNTVANLIAGDPALRAAMFTVANICEILIVAVAMTWRGSVRLLRRSSIIRFAAACLVACIVSTLIAVSVLEQSGLQLVQHEAFIWFWADFLGLLVYAPILWIVLSPAQLPSRESKPAYLTPELLLVVVATVAVFAQSELPLLFLVPPALVLLAVRKGLEGAAVGMVAITIVSILFTLADRGPTMLVEGDPQIRVLVLQVFLAANALMALSAGATAAERARLITRMKVTKRRMAERSTRERLMIKQALLAEHIGQVGYWTVRPGTGDTYWSPEVYRIYGVSPETFDPEMEDGLAPFVPEDREMVADVIRRSIQARSGWQFEADLEKPSGEIVRVRSVGELRLTPDGDVDMIFGVFKDVTEDHRLLEQIREKEALYRLLADNSSDLIARYGRDSVFTYLSPSVEAILGYRPEDLVGRTTAALIHPDDLEHVYEIWRVGLASGLPFAVHYRAIHRDGSIRWMEARPTISRDDDGEIVAYVDTIRDVSDRHEREMALAEAIAAAETASRAKADFLSSMSHEIRTPLNGVLGFADLLMKGELAGDQRHYAGRIQSSARALLSIVNDILDFSRIEAGKMTIMSRPFALSGLVAEAVDLVRAAYPDPRLSITVKGPRVGKDIILGDEDRIRQILLNTIGNAAKFTGQGAVEIAWSIRKGCLRLVVRDTGPGIPPDRIESVFDSFSQADASISRNFGGTGLGLSISRSLARLMDGDITVRSRPGKGTQVALELPAVPAPATGAITPDRGAPITVARRGVRVLVVDDVDINRELLEIGLGQAGHTVTSVDSGEAALSALQSGPAVDVILMDIQMPGMDGMAATRAIRDLPGPAGRVPVIGLSANVLPEQVAACKAAGMTEHLGKPVAMDRLVERIDQLCDGPADKREAPAVMDGNPAVEALKLRYLDHLAGIPAELASLLADGPIPRRNAALAALAHRLAGTSASLGFNTVWEAAARLDTAAQAGTDADEIQQQAEGLIRQIATLTAPT